MEATPLIGRRPRSRARGAACVALAVCVALGATILRARALRPADAALRSAASAASRAAANSTATAELDGMRVRARPHPFCRKLRRLLSH